MASDDKQSSSTQNAIAKFAKPYYEELYKRSKTASQQAYSPYGGQRLAGESADTSAGLDAMRSYAGSDTNYSGLMGNVSGYEGQAAGTADEFGNYNFTGYDPSQFSAYTSMYGGNAIGLNGQDVTGDFDLAAAQKYMSPYTDEVINRTQDDMYEEYLQNQARYNADAASTGAFGGSRAALMNARMNADYQDRAGDYAASARQAAFENAQSQFERDRAARMGLAQQNQEMGMWGQEQNDSVRRFAAEYGLSEEQVRQAALTGQLDSLKTAGSLADQQAMYQQYLDKSTTDRANALLGVGQAEEAYKQEQLDLAYQDFLEKRDWEKNNLAWYAGILNSTGNAPTDSTTNQSQREGRNDWLGILGGIGSIYSAFT